MDAPQWLADDLLACVAPDRVFAAAYDEAGDLARAELKRCLAALFSLHPPRRARSVETRRSADSGLCVRVAETPVDAAVVFLGPQPCGPAQVLAAVHPAVAAGVRDILVLRVGDDLPAWPAAVLAGLELAGRELVLDCSPAQAARLVRDLGEGAAYADLGLDAASFAALGLDRPGLRLWRAPRDPLQAPLALGPGCEQCWAWPDLDPTFFLNRSIALEFTADETPDASERT